MFLKEIWNVSDFKLTFYYTILTFNNPEEEAFRLPAFSPFPTMFSTLSRREIIILATFDLSSAHALNLVNSKILSFGKDLTLSKTSPCFNVSAV